MGEYVTCAMPDGAAQCYVAGSGGPGEGKGVLLFMDAIGLRPQIERMAERIASWGYVVLAPNTFWRSGSVTALAPKTDLRDPANRAAFFASGPMDRVRALTADQQDADLDMWMAALRSRTTEPDIGPPSPLGTVGYCFGGRLALRAAARRPEDFAVVGMFHTGGIVTESPDSPHLLAPRVRAFVLAGHADGDRSNTPEQVRAFDDALEAAGIDHRTAIYPGAEHGFTMADTSSHQATGEQRHYLELREALDAGLTPH